MKLYGGEIFVDFDETIVESIESIRDIIFYKYGTTVAKPKKWNFEDVAPFLNSQELERMFESDEFFNFLTLKPYAHEVLRELSKDYRINVVTVASDIAFPKKVLFLDQKMPFLNDIIQIKFGQSKNVVNMKGSIFFDDSEKNLFECNALRPVMFENIPGAEWNSKWDGEKISSWLDAYKFF